MRQRQVVCRAIDAVGRRRQVCLTQRETGDRIDHDRRRNHGRLLQHEGPSLRRGHKIRQRFRPSQYVGPHGIQRINRKRAEIRAARLRVAVRVAAIVGRRQHGGVGADRKQTCKLLHRDVATGRHLDRDVPIRAGVEERLNRDGRLVVEQDDQLVADMNQRDLLLGDRREVDLHLLVVAKIDDDRLIGQRLRQCVNSYGS